jgi:TolA-binding protein
MNFTKNDIPRYLSGDMSPDEEAAFEKALQTDTELQELLNLHREVERSLKQEWGQDEQRDQLKATMQTLRQEYFGGEQQTGASQPTATQQPTAGTAAPAPGKLVSFKRYVGVAIAAAAVLIVALFVWNPFAGNLYEKYADTQMISQVERGSHVDSVLQEATTAFNSKDFTVAAVNLAEVVQNQPDNSYALFYLGVSLLQTDQVTYARAIFEKLFKGESAFKYEACFYEALSFLKDKDKDTAKDWLEKIPSDAPNYKKAQELMRKL